MGLRVPLIRLDFSLLLFARNSTSMKRLLLHNGISNLYEATVTKDPNVRDKENDPKPTKGTNEPWKRPGQASQNPDETIADKDLDKWKKVVDRHGN